MTKPHEGETKPALDQVMFHQAIQRSKNLSVSVAFLNIGLKKMVRLLLETIKMG